MKYTVFILPAGSGMAVATIKSLKNDPSIRIVTADSNVLSPGLYLADKGYLIPKFTDDKFWKHVFKISAKENVDLIIPALDPILIPFAEKKEEFEKVGIKVMTSPSETIKIARDKWKTYMVLKDEIPMPKSSIDLDNPSLPSIIKPRNGSGSKNVFLVNSYKELKFFYDYVENPMIQEYLPGTEWSIDCLADLDGKLILSIPRIRLETKAGISTKGVIKLRDDLKKIAENISKKLKIQGPFIFQAKEDENNIPKVIEINPRIGGTMILSDKSTNIYSLAIRLFMGENIEIPKISEGIYITRYFEDIFLTENDFKNIQWVDDNGNSTI